MKKSDEVTMTRCIVQQHTGGEIALKKVKVSEAEGGVKNVLKR